MERLSAIKLWNNFAIGNETALFLLNLPERLNEDSPNRYETPRAVKFLREWANNLELKKE